MLLAACQIMTLLNSLGGHQIEVFLWTWRTVTNHTFEESFTCCIWKKNDLFTKWHLILLTSLLLSWCYFLHPTFSQQTLQVYLDFKLLAFYSFYGLCRLSTNLLYTNSALIWYGKACNHGNVLCTLSQALDALFTLYRVEQTI